EQRDRNQHGGHRAESSHNGQRLRCLASFERHVVKADCHLMQQPRPKSQYRSLPLRYMEAERNQAQTKTAQRSQPEDVREKTAGVRATQQHLIPNQRRTNQAVSNHSYDDAVMDKPQSHVSRTLTLKNHRNRMK